MKTQRKLEYKENNGLPGQKQPQHHQHQQRQTRVLEPTHHHNQHDREMSVSDSGSSGGSPSRLHSCGRRYHDNLEASHELVLEPNELGLVWGVAHSLELPGDEGEFKLRLLQRPSLSDQQPIQEQPQDQKPQRTKFKCVEVSRESLDLLCYHEPTIRKLMLSHDKALIFQNIDVQVYVMEEIKAEGFRVHFQEVGRQRTKVSLTYQQFLTFVSALSRVDHDYLKYKKNISMKKARQKANKGLLIPAKCE